MKKQVIVVHGGDTFDSYQEYLEFLKNFKVDWDHFRKKGWKDSLLDDLGEEYEVIRLQMPSKWNAKYLEWKIWFEKHIPFFEEEVILIGHSTGGIFLAKYLSENNFPKKIKGVFLVAPPFGETNTVTTLADFVLPESLSLFAKQAGEIYLYFSKDDKAVLFSELEKYKSALPEARERVFEDRGHFNQESFPELAEDIKELSE